MYTDEFLLMELQRFYNINNKIPTCKDFNNLNGWPNAHSYIRRFGRWTNALVLAGFNINRW